jgi:large subunit ribosomal protein L10
LKVSNQVVSYFVSQTTRLGRVFLCLTNMKKSEKPFFVDNLSEELKAASGYVLVDFNGLSVKMQQELKKRLREINAQMVIVKNTLFKLSATKANSRPEIMSDAVLAGPSALIMTEDDPIAILQVISKFSKEFDVPQLKVGIIEGSFYDKTMLQKLSQLPGKSILQAQVVGSISSPLYAIVTAMQGNLQKLIYILDQKSKNV